MSELNVQTRTLAVMDNLRFLRSINNECVDLIAIDPPFAANETFTGRPKPPITPAEFDEEVALAAAHGAPHNEGIGETRVKDVWEWQADVHPAWKARIEDDYPPVFKVVEAVEASATENEAAYIAFMAVRLIECRRVLKPTGSIYVHCDDHADGYLRMLMDGVFGADNFRNAIAWRRSGGKSDSKKWGRVHDTLLYYTKSADFTWNPQYQPLDLGYVKRAYRYDDQDGRGPYRRLPLHAAGASKGESGAAWLGYAPGDHDRHWATPTKGIMHQYIVDNELIPDWPRAYPSTRDRLDALNKAGLIVHSTGYLPEIKTYLAATKGAAAADFIADIPMASSKEKTGYATQKPLALYERIISASSNPGDVVLDIFAGCATTAVAAERLERQWIACDWAYRSWTMLKRRFHLEGYDLEGATDATKQALAGAAKHKGYDQPLPFVSVKVIGPDGLPDRDDDDPAPYHRLQQAARPASVQSASWSGRIPKDAAKRLLIERFGPVCWGCGFEPRRPNGTIDDTTLQVDHIRARNPAEGAKGNDELYNLALLHSTCNITKRHKLTLEELRDYNALNGLLWVNAKSDLVDLFEATQFAQERIAMHVAEHGYQQPAPSEE